MPDPIEQRPLTDEVYCFVTRVGTQYATLMVSPLFPTWCHPQPMIMKTVIGERVFIGETDKPVGLIPYDSPYALKYAEKMEEFNLYPSGKLPTGPNDITKIKLPMLMSLGVTPYLHYKIDTDGQLYKREGTDKWILQKLQS